MCFAAFSPSAASVGRYRLNHSGVAFPAVCWRTLLPVISRTLARYYTLNTTTYQTSQKPNAKD